MHAPQQNQQFALPMHLKRSARDKVHAMSNATNINPLIIQKHLAKTTKLDEKFGALTTIIDNHMDRSLKIPTVTITHHTANLQAFYVMRAY